MKKDLIIVESPSKANTISKFLNNKYFVKASVGHIRDLPKSTLGVDIENDFKPRYVVDRKKTKTIKEIKEAVKAATAIYLGSDNDREGEAIAWHLKEILKKEAGNKPFYRIIFNEITKNAITKAIKEPTEIDKSKVDAQQARRILDRIVGYTFSPILWSVLSANLSAGRVQSVALRLICEREEEIENFKEEEFWNIEALLFKDSLTPFTAVLKTVNSHKTPFKNKEITDDTLEKLKNEDFEIFNIKDTLRKIQNYAPYITSTLQQDASKNLNYSTKKTMSLAQKLYEGIELNNETVGLITYMRTDSLRISEDAVKACRNFINDNYGENKLSKTQKVYKNKNKAQDAHEAIRPTDVFKSPESVKKYLSEDLFKMYQLIWQRFVASQMKPITLKSKTLEIKAGDCIFSANGSEVIDKGFLEVYPYVSVSLGENIDKGYLKNDSLELKELNGKQGFTKPPPRYSESTLIKELESKGIGRPSTFSSIISTILDRGYTVINQKRFYPTDLGKVVKKVLIGNYEDFFNVKFTAEMESNLDSIEYGKLSSLELLSKYYSKIKDLTKSDVKELKKNIIEHTDIKCEKCQNYMIIKWIKKKQVLACSNYPDCQNIKNFNRDDKGDIKILEPEMLNEKCPKDGFPLQIKIGRFGKFIACSNYPECRFVKPITLGIKCPDCGKGELIQRKSKKGKVFYSCTQYPNCKFITNSKPVDSVCPECNNYYLEEKFDKDEGSYYVCPKCKQRLK